MSTIKLYHTDADRTEFTAQVRSCVPAGEKWDVILDQTCFYATAGGQPNDLGTLGGARVLDVREDEANGEIIHTVDAPLSGEVRGEIDWARRLDHSEQHTGQHLLSGVFERMMDGETVSWHLGADSCSVDIAIDAMNVQQAEQIELECNRVIRACLPVITHVVDKEGVKAFPMRKPPAVEGDIRVVEIQGYDWSGCGGTHVRSTGELGLLKIKSWEKNKKFVRVEFLVGQRALRDYMRLDLMTRELARSLSIHVMDLPGYVDRSKEESAGLRKQMKMAQERLLEIEATELVAEARKIAGVRVVQQIVGARPVDEVKLLAGKVAAHPGTVAIFGTRGAMPQIVLYRSVDLRLDMGGMIRQVLPLIGGKGGGSPIQAQGAGSRPEALEQALDEVMRLVAEAVKV